MGTGGSGLGYFYALSRIRCVLEREVPYFPESCCQLSARVVSRVVGLEEVAGEYASLKRWHAWNYDSELRLYVDLTQDQFSGCRDKICILPADTHLLRELPWCTAAARACEDIHLHWHVCGLIERLKQELAGVYGCI